MSVRVQLYKGSEMKDEYSPWYFSSWRWSQVPQWVGKIDPNKLYAVKEDFEEWESHGIAGDDEGESHTILYIEEVPPGIQRILEEVEKLHTTLNNYRSEVCNKK